MNGKKAGKALLFPPIAVLAVLTPLSAACLAYALMYEETASPIAIAAYMLAFYTLTLWCVRVPAICRIFKTISGQNRHLRRWKNDLRLRVTLSLYGSLAWNAAYALLQLGLGVQHRSFWFCSLAVYYATLACMRFFLVRHTGRHGPRANMGAQLKKYRGCGILLLAVNVTLSVMIFFMVYWNRTFVHREITAIALAAYTFGSLAMAIVNVIKYRRYHSPVYSASKAISLAAACVSMLTLESTMLTTFGGESTDALTRRIMLAATGAAVSALIIAMAVSMIVRSTKAIKQLHAAEEQQHET